MSGEDVPDEEDDDEEDAGDVVHRACEEDGKGVGDHAVGADGFCCEAAGVG